MRGSVRKPRTKGGTWSYRLDLGVRVDGGRDQKQVGGFRTRREAEAAMAEALTDLRHGAFVAPSRQTVDEFLTRWLEAVRVELAESGWTHYRRVVRTYIAPRIGHLRLADLTPQSIQALYAELLRSGKRDGSPLAPKSVGQVHKTLHRAMADGVRWGQLFRNPLDNVRGPKTTEAEQQVWSLEEVRRFIESSRSDRLHALWLISLHTGMRRGELAGLRWKDVDLDRATLAVTQQRTTVDYRVVVVEPKAGSRRLIPLAGPEVEALRAHRRAQLEERVLLGEAWTDSGYVFVREDGVPYHPQRIRGLFERVCHTANVRAIRLHDVRHTMATASLQAGIHPKVVQERLGHASISMTLDTYSQVVPSMQQEAAERLSALFGAAGTEARPAGG